MLELCIIRHGQAGKSGGPKAEDDARRLTKKGKEKVKEIAKGLKELEVNFDVVLTSPLPRAKETAEIVYDYCGNTEKVTVTSLLKPGSSYNNLIKYLSKLKDATRVAIVGHEPFLSGFASYCLSKNNNHSFIDLKKGGAIMLVTNKSIKPGNCLLSWLMEPKHIAKQK